jgi:hypothetical protein
MAEWLKFPSENLDYAFDFAARLDTGEAISSYTVTVPTGLTKGATAQADGVVTVWLDGGTAGTYYPIDCVVTTSAGREMAERVTMYVR